MSEKKFHISIAVADFTKSVTDYNKRIGQEAEMVVPNKYALWRTEQVNFTIVYNPHLSGQVRHLGFEETQVNFILEDKDCNGITWQKFSHKNQLEEIKEKYGI